MTRYLSRRPKLEAGKELRELALKLTESSREDFVSGLEDWYARWKDFLAEKTVDSKTERWHFTHRKVRSAYRSLRTNLPWLFTYRDHPKLKIPKTTNSCDGSFAHWKNKVKIHRGLRKDRRKKMVDFLLESG